MTKAGQVEELRAERDRLRAKYPPEVYNRLKEEPEDILAFTRQVTRAQLSEADYHSIFPMGVRVFG